MTFTSFRQRHLLSSTLSTMFCLMNTFPLSSLWHMHGPMLPNRGQTMKCLAHVTPSSYRPGRPSNDVQVYSFTCHSPPTIYRHDADVQHRAETAPQLLRDPGGSVALHGRRSLQCRERRCRDLIGIHQWQIAQRLCTSRTILIPTLRANVDSGV